MNEIERKIKRANKTKTPELIQSHQKFTDVAGVSVPKVCKVLQKQCKITNDAVEAGKIVAESFEEFSVLNPQGRLLSQTAEFQSNMEDLRLKLLTSIDTEVINPLAENVEKHVNMTVKTERTKFKEARATWENSVNALTAVRNNKKAQQPMIDKAKQDKDKSYDHLMNEVQPQFIRSLFEVTNTVECDLLEKLTIFYESQQHFLKKNLENIEKILPDLKKQAEKKRTELEFMKQDMNRSYRVFGEEILVVLEREQSKVPSIAIKCLGYLKNHVEEVGIFRLSGNKLKVDTLRRMVDDGKSTDFSTINESAVITSLLKLYLKMLPAPLMTFELYAHFTAVGSADEPEDITVMTSQLKELVDMLPPHNKILLQYMMQFLGTVAEKREKNKMDFANLGTVFAPTILYPRVETTDIESINAANKVIERLVKYYDLIFTDPLPDDIENYSNDTRSIDIFGEPPTNVNEISAVANLLASPGGAQTDDHPGTPLSRNSSSAKSRGEIGEIYHSNNNNNNDGFSSLSMSLQMPLDSPQPTTTNRRSTFRHSLDLSTQISSMTLGLDSPKPESSTSNPDIKPSEEPVIERRMTRSHTISSPSKFKQIKTDLDTEVLSRGETAPMATTNSLSSTKASSESSSGEKSTPSAEDGSEKKAGRKFSSTLRLLGRKKKDKDAKEGTDDPTASPARRDSDATPVAETPTTPAPATSTPGTPSTPSTFDSPSQKTREKSLMSFLTLRKGKKKDKDSRSESKAESRSEETTRDYSSSSNTNDTPTESTEFSQSSQPTPSPPLQEIPIEYADVSSTTDTEVGQTVGIESRGRSESTASALSAISEVSEESNPELLATCPSCSAELQAWSKYCASCGWSKEKKETTPASTPSKSTKPVCAGFRPGKPKSICKRCGHTRDEHKKKCKFISLP